MAKVMITVPEKTITTNIVVPSYQLEVDVPDPAQADGVPAGYKLVWSDEFEGNALDTTKWKVRSGYHEGGTRQGWLLAQNVVVSNGTLKIIGKKEAVGDRQYTTGSIDTRGIKAWQYGWFECRAKMPTGNDKSGGLWPAFWMRPVDSASNRDGELDIMESIGYPKAGDTVDRRKQYKATVWGTYSPPQQKGRWTPNQPTNMSSWHTYAMEWTPDFARFLCDGTEFFKMTRAEFAGWDKYYNDPAKPYFLWVNMQMGGDMPGQMQPDTVLPATYEVDYVRVYQKQ